MVIVNLIMQMFYCSKNAQYVFFKYFFQVYFFFQAFLVYESKIWLSPQTSKKGLAKNKKRTKTVKPTNQNATLLWLDPILCAKNLCKARASAQIELLLLYTTTSQYLCQTAVPPLRKPLNLEEYKQPTDKSNSKFIYRQSRNMRISVTVSVLDWSNLENLLDTVGLPNSKKCETVSPIYKPLNLEE